MPSANSSAVELRHLRAFCAVAEELNFTRAAARIHVAQQTLSDTIAQLEHHLDVVLVERTSRQVRLTRAGDQFYARAQEVLAAMTAAIEEVGGRENGNREVRVGILTTSGIEIRSAVLQRVTRNTGFSVITSAFGFTDPWCGLLSGETDVAFTIEPVDRPGISTFPLYQEPRVALMSAEHPLLSREAITLNDLVQYPAAALEAQSADPHLQRWSDHWQLQPGPTGRRPTPWVGRDLEGWLAAVATSDTVSSCPASFATLYRRPDLVYRPIDGLGPCTHLLAFRTVDANTEVVRAFAQALSEADVIPE